LTATGPTSFDRAPRRTSVAIVGIRVIAFLSAVDDAVPARWRFNDASRGTSISVKHVAVVALLRSFDDTIPAHLNGVAESALQAAAADGVQLVTAGDEYLSVRLHPSAPSPRADGDGTATAEAGIEVPGGVEPDYCATSSDDNLAVYLHIG
jgi:hypothetical protein